MLKLVLAVPSMYTYKLAVSLSSINTYMQHKEAIHLIIYFVGLSYKHNSDGRHAHYINNMRRANTCDPDQKFLNEEITSDIHKQNIWRGYLDVHLDNRYYIIYAL